MIYKMWHEDHEYAVVFMIERRGMSQREAVEALQEVKLFDYEQLHAIARAGYSWLDYWERRTANL